MIPWLSERARSTPERVGLEIGASEVSFAELDESVRRVEARLRGAGLRRGDVLATLLGNGRGFVECLHAAIRCNAVILPIHSRATVSEVAFAIGDSGARLVVHGPGALSSVAEEVASSLPIGCIEAPEDPSASLAGGTSGAAIGGEPEIDPASTLAILYTSGTTGRPKGARLRYESFVWNAAATALHLGSSPDDRWLACLPLFHVGGLAVLVRSVLAGSTVVVHERFDPQAVARALRDDRLAGASLVPTMLARVLDVSGGAPFSTSLRCVLVGGGPLSEELLARARAARLPVAPTYGLTEATSQVATAPPWEVASGLAARALPGIEIRIEGEDGAILPAGRAGEVCVRGPTLMSGYHGLAEETSRALRGGWLHTGDVGVVDHAGRLRILDRRSDLVVSGGENVYPAEVESVLARHPGVAEAAVAGEPDRDLGQRVVAAVVPRAGAALREETLRDFCRERLARHKIPKRISIVSELPKTSSGKILRRAIREPGS